MNSISESPPPFPLTLQLNDHPLTKKVFRHQKFALNEISEHLKKLIEKIDDPKITEILNNTLQTAEEYLKLYLFPL